MRKQQRRNLRTQRASRTIPAALHIGCRTGSNLEPIDAISRILPLRDNSLQVVFANYSKQSGTIVIEMAGQQNAPMLANDPLKDHLPARQRQRPEITALMHQAIEDVEPRTASAL